jgi:hypothetical protein
MGPWNWRSSLMLELWVFEMTYAQWRRCTSREHRARVYLSYQQVWNNPDLIGSLVSIKEK